MCFKNEGRRGFVERIDRVALGFCGQIFLHERDGLAACEASGGLLERETFVRCAVL